MDIYEQIKSAIEYGEWERRVRHHDPKQWLVMLAVQFGKISTAVLENEEMDFECDLVNMAAACAAMVDCRERTPKIELARKRLDAAIAHAKKVAEVDLKRGRGGYDYMQRRIKRAEELLQSSTDLIELAAVAYEMEGCQYP